MMSDRAYLYYYVFLTGLACALASIVIRRGWFDSVLVYLLVLMSVLLALWGGLALVSVLLARVSRIVYERLRGSN